MNLTAERTAIRLFKSKAFARFARQNNIDNASLREAVFRAEQGNIDADLGAGVIKQRVARRDEGKSGGFRTIIYFRRNERAFFIHGFAKSDKANIDANELRTFKKAASIVLALTEAELAAALKARVYIEIEK